MDRHCQRCDVWQFHRHPAWLPSQRCVEFVTRPYGKPNWAEHYRTLTVYRLQGCDWKRLKKSEKVGQRPRSAPLAHGGRVWEGGVPLSLGGSGGPPPENLQVFGCKLWHLVTFGIFNRLLAYCMYQEKITHNITYILYKVTESLTIVNFSLQPFPPPSISDAFVYPFTLNHITHPFHMYVPAARHDWKTKENSTNFSLTSGRNTNMLCRRDAHMAAWPPTPTSIKMDTVIG